MLKKVLKRIFEPRHFWRDAGYSELNELYASNLLRRLSISVLMIFVPIYLFRHGYSVPIIFGMFGMFFVARSVFDFVSGYSVARYGPKHTLIISTFLQVVSSALFMTVPSHHWSFALLGSVWGISTSFYFIPFHVEFSKIKHSKHSGSEIGFMNITERIGAVLGPALGGLLATLFGSPSIFVAATAVALASLWPLFQSAEPVKTHQHLDFKNFPLARALRDIGVSVACGVENTICINLWPFYVALFVLSSSVYAQLGIMSSVAVLVSIYSARLTGQLLDKHSGVKLLRISAITNAILHLTRPFVHSIMPAYGVSIANEVITNGYRIPYIKGMYAAADEYPGHRIVYVVVMESVGCVAKAGVWFLLAICAAYLGTRTSMNIGFVVASSASLLIMTERFSSLRMRSNIKA